MSQPELRILVIDDEPAMVGAVAALVGSAGHRIIAAYDGRDGVTRFEEERPDLILLDLAMPGLDGLAVVRAVRERDETPIIVLSGEGDELAKVTALDVGADDYITKPFGRDELLARIRAVWRRRSAAPEPIAPSRLVLDRPRHEVRFEGTPLGLTRVEFNLLAALIDAGGRLVSHAELLRAGWPDEHDPDPLWPKPHLARLRSKLLAAGAPLPISVRGVGYRLETADA